ncbi:7348_t:CDS:2 [Entrophospora sp. SA101]|nr:15431_t:CDS:2 [Entrophospora sp. SA101]CAJ0634364.1 7348_t:CDS:2 [Entrophospora sp. SA101]
MPPCNLDIIVDQHHLPMAFSTDYPPIDQSIECHLKDTCMKSHLNSSDQNFQQFIKLTLLPCESIINRLTSEKDLPIEDDPEDEIQPLEIDEPEELQMAFNLQAEIEFDTALQEFLMD